MPLAKREEPVTYQDYLSCPEDERWEIIDGIAYNMVPAPGTRHQSILGNLYFTLRNAMRKHRCRPFIAPTDVVLSEENVVEPDLFVVCDQTKITEKCIRGAPDVVFEIISPSSSKKDRLLKRRLYEKFGVKEYILVDLDAPCVERFLLDKDGRYRVSEIFDSTQTLTLRSLDGVDIPLGEMFDVGTESRETQEE